MESLTLVVVLLILLVFTGLLIFSIATSRKAKEAKAQMGKRSA